MNVITFGCRLNAYESDVINGFLKKYKLEDVIVVNTCSVTAEAERQALQKIRQLKRKFSNMRIIVTGCSANMDALKFKENIVDFVIGNIEKLQEDTYKKIAEGTFERISVSDFSSKRDLPENIITPSKKKIRGYLPIQTGCNYECTFCAVKLTRGKAKSFSVEHIIEQAKIFAQHYNEIVLTGININAFGWDLTPKLSLADLVGVLLKSVPEINFLSLSSLDPFAVDRELIDLFRVEKKMLPHVHLSIQSGDNKVLSLMKRRHTREKVIDVCNKLKAINQDIRIGADIITGFPSETEEAFNNSLNLIDDADLDFLHTFPFSKRPGTEACDFLDQVDKKIAKERSKLLRAKIDEKLKKYLQSMIGKEIEFFVENNIHARTMNYIDVEPLNEHFKNINSVEKGEVVSFNGNKLVVDNV